MFYELPPPNEGMQYLDTLRFGRSEYEEIRTAHARKYTGTPLPHPDWRDTLSPPDPFACKPIHRDPERNGWKVPGYQGGIMLWMPSLMEECIYSYPPVVDAVRHVAATLSHSASQANQVSSGNLVEFQIRPLTKELRVMFAVKYKPDASARFEGHPASASVIDGTGLTAESHWAKSEKYFSLAIGIIARWCVHNYYDQPDVWAAVLAQYGNLGERWQEIIENRWRREATGKKYRIKRSHELQELASHVAPEPITTARSRIRIKRRAEES